MTLPSSPNSISFGQIEAEFGQNPGRSLGQYRRQDPSRITLDNTTGILSNSSPPGSDLNLPLDTGIPNSGEIRFSQFRGKQLNMIVDYYADRENLNKQAQNDFTMAATYRYLNQEERVKVVGGFRQRPLGSVNSNYVLSSSDWQGGKKIIVHVNQTVGGRKDGDVTDVALRTGVWPTGTNLSVDVGPSGYLTGAGGDGGAANQGNSNNADDGGNGTSALGVEYPAIVSVASGGVIRCGYGGGGGGSGASNNPNKSMTDFGRSGAGGGGGAGLPAGAGGAGGSGGFNGSNTPPAGPINGTAGFAGDLEGGGLGGDAGATGGATGGDGGNGGDFEADAEDGDKGIRGRNKGYENTPGEEGSKGSNGKAIYFSNSSVESSSDIDAANVGGRNGGTAIGSIN